MTWSSDAPQGHEAKKIRWECIPYMRGRILDLGCGNSKVFPKAIGVDNGHHAREFGWDIKPDLHVETCEDLSLVCPTQTADTIFSSHLLEHLADPKKALRDWWRVLRKGGHLILYLPDKSLYPNIGKEGANPDHRSDFCQDDIIEMMKEIGSWDLLRNEQRSEGIEYSFFQVYRKS